MFGKPNFGGEDWFWQHAIIFTLISIWQIIVCREQSWNIFHFEWNAQFWFLSRCKSFVFLIVNIFNANYSTRTDKSSPLLTFAPSFSFSFLTDQNIFELLLKNWSLSLGYSNWKALCDEMGEKGTSFWCAGAIS